MLPPPGQPENPITALLAAAGHGDAAARERLWSVVYDELHRIAQGQLAGDGRRGPLQATTLVHEVYLRLFGSDHVSWNNRRHFYATAARAMRSIRVDDVRRRGRQKRGGGRPALPLGDCAAAEARQVWGGVNGADPGDEDAGTLLAVDAALTKLERTDPRKAEIVMLRYFAGLTVDQTAEALGLSPRTVDSEWRFARAWLHQELSV